MAKVKYVVYGDDRAHVSANNIRCTLKVNGQEGEAIFFAKTKEEIRDIINEINDSLNEIKWELDRYGSVFSGICEEEKPEEEKGA